MNISFLFVTCCLEQSRSDVLPDVVANILEQAPELKEQLIVFDNGSTQPGVRTLLCDSFKNVFGCETNVGYWTAIDWWLSNCVNFEYTYIIESDMMHYQFNRIYQCESYLDKNPQIGAVRLHEYSVANRHLYNKDIPHADSRRTLWLSHTNKVNNKPVAIEYGEGDIWNASFLTQLPALNRSATMKRAFAKLHELNSFCELDFQRFYYDEYQVNAILDGGLFNCPLSSYGSKTLTGSWSSEAELRSVGYKSTRYARIIPSSQYKVTSLK